MTYCIFFQKFFFCDCGFFAHQEFQVWFVCDDLQMKDHFHTSNLNHQVEFWWKNYQKSKIVILSLELMINFALYFQQLYNIEEFRSLQVSFANNWIASSYKQKHPPPDDGLYQAMIDYFALRCLHMQKTPKMCQKRSKQVINWHCFVTIHQKIRYLLLQHLRIQA